MASPRLARADFVALVGRADGWSAESAARPDLAEEGAVVGSTSDGSTSVGSAELVAGAARRYLGPRAIWVLTSTPTPRMWAALTKRYAVPDPRNRTAPGQAPIHSIKGIGQLVRMRSGYMS